MTKLQTLTAGLISLAAELLYLGVVGGLCTALATYAHPGLGMTLFVAWVITRGEFAPVVYRALRDRWQKKNSVAAPPPKRTR